jgi:hypothetical protein
LDIVSDSAAVIGTFRREVLELRAQIVKEHECIGRAYIAAGGDIAKMSKLQSKIEDLELKLRKVPHD